MRYRPHHSLLALLVTACGADDRIEAPAPVARAIELADTALTLAPSIIEVPVEYDLGPALAWMETALPRRMGNLEERIEVPGNDRLSFAFSAERSPFRLSLNGATATLSAEVSYRGRGWYNPPVLPTISGSCGLNEPPPRVRVTVRTLVTPTADWKLRARTRVVQLAPLTELPRDRCTVTAAAVNVTDRILAAVRTLLDRELRVVDRQLAAYDLRSRVEDVWSFLNTPIALQDSLWLVINPTAIRLDTVRSEGTTLYSSVGVTAFPRVIGGGEPAVRPGAVPNLERSGSPAGLELLSEASVGWDVLSGILQRELRGDTIRVADRDLVLEEIAVSGLDDGRVAVGLTVRGAVRGTIYLVGTPVYHPLEASLTMPDLEFDVQTRSLMVAGLAWLADGRVEEHLRTDLRLSLEGVLADLRGLLERELTREPATGVKITTTVDRGQIVRVRARRHGLLADLVVGGQSELRLALAPETRVARKR